MPVLPKPPPVSSRIISQVNYLRSLKRSQRLQEHKRLTEKLLDEFGSRAEISRRCGIPVHSVCKALRPKVPRMQRKKKAAALRKAVAEFYQRPTNSMTLPDATNANKRYLTDTLKRTHEKFLKEFPRIHCSFPHFAKLRPWKSVKLAGMTPRRMCVCQSCENACLMARSLSRAGISGLELTVGGALDQMWCPYQGRHPLFPCVQGTCQKCGPHKLKEKVVIPEALDRNLVKWKRWENVHKDDVELVKSGPAGVKTEVDNEVKSGAACTSTAIDAEYGRGVNKPVRRPRRNVGNVAIDTEVKAGPSNETEGAVVKRRTSRRDAAVTRTRDRAPSRVQPERMSCSANKRRKLEDSDLSEIGDSGETSSSSSDSEVSFVSNTRKQKRSCKKRKSPKRNKRRKLEDSEIGDSGETGSSDSDVSSPKQKRSYKKHKSEAKQRKDRVDIVDKVGTVAELFDSYLDTIWNLRFHHFLANWQLHQFHRFRIELRVGTILQVVDFSQNYLHVHQDEVTSAHWDHSQTTFFPLVNQFRCPDVKCPKLITLEQMFFSPSKDHTHFAVDSFVARGLQELQDLGVEIGDICRWSDNCGKQFKSKGPFVRLANSEIPITLVFFGERHGKSLADGLGGRTKLAIRRARDRRGTVFKNAADLFNFCRAEVQSPREDFEKLRAGVCGSQFSKSHFLQSFHLVEEHDFSLKVPATGVQGTTGFHIVRSTGNPNVIDVRDVACTCLKCYYGIGQTCRNEAYTDPWKRTRLNRRLKDNFQNDHFPLNANDSLAPLGKDVIGNMNDFIGEKPDSDCSVVLSRLPVEGIAADPVLSRRLTSKPMSPIPLHPITEMRRAKLTRVAPSGEDDAENGSLLLSRQNLLPPSLPDGPQPRRHEVPAILEDESDYSAYSDEFQGEDTSDDDDVIVLGGETTTFAETAEPGWSDPFFTNGIVPADIIEGVDADITVVSDVSDDELCPPQAVDGRRVNWTLIYKELRGCRSFKELEEYSKHRRADLPPVPFTSASFNSSMVRDCFAAVPADAPPNRFPVETVGDGNCLLRAASLFVAGHEGHHVELRCRVTIELAANSASYLDETNMARASNSESTVVEQFAHYSPFFEPLLSPREIFERETLKFRLLKTYSGAWAIAALANVLQRPVLSIYPLGLLRDLNRAFTTFSPRFRRREAVVIMWVDLGAAWHFVPLITDGISSVDITFWPVCHRRHIEVWRHCFDL